MFPGLTGSGPTKPITNLKGMNNSDMTASGPIATQNLGGNSLTQFMRSLQNYASTQGASTYDWGQDLIHSGAQGFADAGAATDKAMGTTDKALGASDEAMGTSRAALDTLHPAEDYWTKLLSGDQETMNKAIAPYATQVGHNFANATTAAQQGMARGGYSAALSANLPFAQSTAVNNELFKLQPQAATNLNTIAGTKNNIAGTQGQIAGVQNNIAGTQGQIAQIKGQLSSWLSSIGIDVSKLGQGFMDMAIKSIMEGRGQDVAEHGQSMQMASQLAGDVENAAGGAWVKSTVGH